MVWWELSKMEVKEGVIDEKVKERLQDRKEEQRGRNLIFRKPIQALSGSAVLAGQVMPYFFSKPKRVFIL